MVEGKDVDLSNSVNNLAYIRAIVNVNVLGPTAFVLAGRAYYV